MEGAELRKYHLNVHVQHTSVYPLARLLVQSFHIGLVALTFGTQLLRKSTVFGLERRLTVSKRFGHCVPLGFGLVPERLVVDA